jgi:4-alpha-glucanotransferase
VSGPPLALCFGVHNHQPIGNFEHVLTEATARAYQPFLERLRDRPEVRLTMHWTGSLLEWLRDRTPGIFDLLGTVVARGQVELLTGGYYEPILAILPDHDKVGQIQHLTEFIRAHFGVQPRGMWLAERVWEPQLPRPVRQAGVEYVLVDDRHFTLAGFDPETLGGYYLTEEQGAVVGVFPISQRLRYLIPFADVAATVEHLEERRGQVVAVTVVDDGEKFGVWPGTHARVYEDGWLDRFFERLLGLNWLTLSTFAEVVDRQPASGRAYLPTASYREMGEWALPPAAARELEGAKRDVATLADGERLQRLLRGGFWRAFLVKYPEVADTYWKMLRLSEAIERARPTANGDPRLDQARLAVWRGQANDAYWHGVFGGCYLPHLRRAVKQALLEAERLLDQVTGAPAVAWAHTDGNGDGQAEVVVRTGELAVTVCPAEGGMVTELSHRERGLDLADVLARRPEAYHDQLRHPGAPGPAGVRTIHAPPVAKETGLDRWIAYDDVRRGSLLDGLFPPGEPLDPVAPWLAAWVVLSHRRLRPDVAPTPSGMGLTMVPERAVEGLTQVEKRVLVEGARVEARYRLRASAPPFEGRWAVQWNLALTAGDGGHRYFELPDRPALASRGRRQDLDGLTLVDEWVGLEARLTWSPDGEVGWGPVETVSVSEEGFERIYQGTALLITWPLVAASNVEWELTTALTVNGR